MRKKSILTGLLIAFFIFVLTSCVWGSELTNFVPCYTTCHTNVYLAPDAANSDFYEIPSCTKVTGTKFNDDYYLIDCCGVKGYVQTPYISLVDPAFQGRNITPSSTYEFLFNDGVSNEKFKLIEDSFNNVPVNVLAKFVNSGWKIYVSDRNLDKLFRDGNSSILGILMSDRQEIWISHRVKSGDTVIHEFGHFIDGHDKIGSSNPEFVLIHSEEVGAFAKYHKTHRNNYSTAYEYFAESYSEFILHPDALYKACPKTYSYFINFTSSISGENGGF